MIRYQSRRTALASAGLLLSGFGLAPLLAGRAMAQQDYYALGPDWQINWRAHRTSSRATATQIESGVAIATSDDEVTSDETTIGLWAKRIVTGDFEFSFTYRVTGRLDVAGGSFACFYFCTLGQGTERWPEAVPNWRRVTPSDKVYADHARGLRFSFATYNPRQPDLEQRLRLRWFSRTTSVTLVEPPSPAVFPFTLNRAYEARVRRAGDMLQVSVTPPADSGEEPQGFTWEDPAIGQWSGGYVGFRWRAQDAELTNTSLRQL